MSAKLVPQLLVGVLPDLAFDAPWPLIFIPMAGAVHYTITRTFFPCKGTQQACIHQTVYEWIELVLTCATFEGTGAT